MSQEANIPTLPNDFDKKSFNLMIDEARLKTATDTQAFSRALKKRKDKINKILRNKFTTPSASGRNVTLSKSRDRNNSTLAMSFINRVEEVEVGSYEQKSCNNNSMLNFKEPHQ